MPDSKSKNFLIVVPKCAFVGEYYFFPVGLGYVISSLKQAGFNVFCLNMCHYEGSAEEQLVPYVEKHNIDVICSGGITVHWSAIEDIFVTARKYFPDKTTIAGGSIITSEPEVAMTNMPIDFGVIGEGEITIVELAKEICENNMNPAGVNGLIYHTPSGELIKTAERQVITDLDALPFPDYEAMEYDKYLEIRWSELPSVNGIYYDIDENQKVGDLLTSRSCPYSCTFCYHPLGKKYRQRSLENVFLEIEYLVSKYDIRLLNVLDELFSLNKNRIREFCTRIKKYNIEWMAQWRVDNIDAELFQECKDSGLNFLGLGVESMSDTVLQSMKKNTTVEQVNKAFKMAAEVGISPSANLIFGDINESKETLEESLKWFFENPALDINLAVIRAIPDSEIWRYCLEKGLIEDKRTYFATNLPNINFSKLSDKDYTKCEIMAKKSRWYYYTPRGKEIESQVLDAMYEGKKTYSFKVECPHCNKVSSYKYYCITRKPLFSVICKSCKKGVAVRTKKIFYQDYNFFTFLIYNLFIDNLTDDLRKFYAFHLKKFKLFRTVVNPIKKTLKMK
jgi:radical SAM superfamily enzyme YgiQ (UPF0313 family)